VMPGTLTRPSLVMALRAFFSLREWTIAPPAGIPVSPVSTSESELSDPSSSAVTFLETGSSSGSSSIRGFDMLGGMSVMVEKLADWRCGLFGYFKNISCATQPGRILRL
jgi:hypothetical protein